jgi:hypothetical protein
MDRSEESGVGGCLREKKFVRVRGPGGFRVRARLSRERPGRRIEVFKAFPPITEPDRVVALLSCYFFYCIVPVKGLVL